MITKTRPGIETTPLPDPLPRPTPPEAPTTLWESIILALDDIERCERSEQYKVDMMTWHGPIADQCHVCLAGSVIAQTLGADPLQSIVPVFFIGGWYRVLRMLHYAAYGNFALAYDILYQKPATGNAQEATTRARRLAVGPWPSYSQGHSEWKSRMRQCAAVLEEAGI